MNTYFINTDASSNNGRSLHSEWLRRGIAVTSGSSDYRGELRKLDVGDRLLMYVNGEGVLAVGDVADGNLREVTGERTVNPTEGVEYHRTVRWTALAHAPIRPQELRKLGFVVRRTITPVLPQRLAALFPALKQASDASRSGTGRFTPERASAALLALRQRCRIEPLTPKGRSQQYHFGGGRARSLVVSKDMHEDWVRVYINRQSRSLEWFPVEPDSNAFRGVEVGYRYIRGHVGLKGQPGIAASAAQSSTLRPLDNHVLLLHCSDEQGFKDLVCWYAGGLSIGPGRAPSAIETSGEGPWTDLVTSSPAAQPAPGALTQRVPAADLLPGEPQSAAALPDTPAEAGRSHEPEAGWMNDPIKRCVVELHAVDAAKAWYMAQGYRVQVLGKPYDLLCTRDIALRGAGPDAVHVEVKGSLGTANCVRLTRNEVDHARNRDGWRSDLFVLSEIELVPDLSGGWRARGGRQRLFEDWSPRDEDLAPTEFEYRLPA